MKKILMVILFVSSSLFAEIGIDSPVEHVESPNLFDDVTTKMENGSYTSGTESQNNENLIGNDGIPDSNLSNGTRSLIRVGSENNISASENEYGDIIINQYSLEEDLNTTGNDTEESYQDLVRNSLLRDLNQSDEDAVKAALIQENLDIAEQKRKQLEKTQSSNESYSERRIKYLTKANPKNSSGLVSIFTETNLIEGNVSKEQDLNEINATKYYKENLSNITDMEAANNFKINGNFGASKGFTQVETLEDELTAMFKGKEIKCYIARQLIPSYKCPINYKNAIRFPSLTGDIRRTNLEEALADCNNYCVTDPGDFPIIHDNIFNNDNFDTGITNQQLIPFNNYPLSFILDNDDRMPLKEITLTINVQKPLSFQGSDAEWEEKLSNDYSSKFKISIIAYRYSLDRNNNLVFVPIDIYNKYQLNINSSVVSVTLPLFEGGVKYKILIYKPFFQTNQSTQNFLSDGGQIILSRIESKYMSTSYHYCSLKQFVQQKSDCFGGNVKELSNAGQTLYLCYDRSHKIGPEPTTGAFYNEENAKQQCVERIKCVPTYTSVSSTGSITPFLETAIGCVDSPDNTACTDADCQSLFGSDASILEETTLKLKNGLSEFVKTISNGVRTEEPRPKITNNELTSSLSTEEDFNEDFILEEKDSAIINMIENVTYNKFKYRIGEESPAIVAYSSQDNLESLNAILKPASFDYVSTNNFYIYAISMVDSIFAPVAGTWLIDGKTVSVINGDTTINGVSSQSSLINQNEVIPLLFPNDPEKQEFYENILSTEEPFKIMDRTYFIKESSSPDVWKVFRKIRNFKFFAKKIHYFTDTNTTNNVSELKYTIEKKWIKVPAYYHANFETYAGSDQFNAISQNDIAPYFDTISFTPEQTFYNIPISEDVIMSRYLTPGVMFSDQEIINNGTYFKRLYDTDTRFEARESKFFNQKFWLVYSNTQLTYDELLEKIKGSSWEDEESATPGDPYIVIGLANKGLYRTEIPDDGILNNNIKIFKKGTPSQLTFELRAEPKVKDKGKKIYKFVFLFSEQEFGQLDLNVSNTTP